MTSSSFQKDGDNFPTARIENLQTLSSQKELKISSSESGFIKGGTAGSVALEHPTSFPKTKTNKVLTKPEKPISWSMPVQAMLDQPPATLPQRLIYGGIAFCLIFGTWAWFGTIEEVGHASGKLIPKGETYKIEPLDIGKVSRIAVKEGDTVTAGQVLVELDRQLEEKEIERLEQLLINYQMELAQKQNLLEKISLEAQTYQAISQAQENEQRAAIAQAKEKIKTTQEILLLQQRQYSAYQTRQDYLQPLSGTAQERLEELEKELLEHQKRIEKLQSLVEEGAVSQEYVFQAEQAMRATKQQILQSQLQEGNNVKEQLFQAQQSLRDLQTNITQKQGELNTAFKEAERLESELTSKQAQAQQTQLQYQQQKQKLALEITQIQGKITETQNLLVTAKTKLQYKYLKAPVDGVVLSLNIQNTGKVVETGNTIAEIAPEGVPLELSATLVNREAGFVQKGMPVQIKFDAYPYQDYGIISGKVSSISEDAKTDEDLGEVYQVKVELEQNYIQENQQPIQFKAGQTASADIIIRRRRIIDILLDPIKQLQKDGIKL
ncbi:secretion protein HlyD family protein [Gloeothece citriformis PCC 7424]|uniref:Secretion protein HlyD family protein n=1 Tax=Gloeothece citriformis (strain PCC 7424) TaxID=65393 RepID=B7KGI3_GLOC7|nr:HlyD family efflux transporter periplasmic adaptor subunit [Gloeothece citriformis]ACK71910.1 secretion protein HlyD family protein [Gloeothece citriformis PCC 7424]